MNGFHALLTDNTGIRRPKSERRTRIIKANSNTGNIHMPFFRDASPVRFSSREFPVGLTLLAALLLTAPSLRAQEPDGDPEPAVESAPADEAQAAARIDEILTAQQKQSDGLKDIRCAVQFTEDDRVNLSRRTKSGRIAFKFTSSNPNFMIHFDKVVVDDVLGRQEWYLFDGRWLYTALERIKQVTKQEVVREGERIDLFDLEKAPFPLPFGQKKETILRNFNVSLVPPAAGDPPDTDHLMCLPKPESPMYRKYDSLEFFIRRDMHMPGRIIATKNDGLEVHIAEFPDLAPNSINAGVKDRDFVKPSAWSSYKEVVETLDANEQTP